MLLQIQYRPVTVDACNKDHHVSTIYLDDDIRAVTGEAIVYPDNEDIYTDYDRYHGPLTLYRFDSVSNGWF